MNIINYAPVVIPTLCRSEHFIRCISTLMQCKEAKYTDLIIGLDHPTKDSHWKGYKIIDEFIKNITGFKKVIVFKHETNLGAVDNIAFLREYVNEHYGRYIFTEDDNEFSPNFLEYINKGLERFKDDPRVYSICGYNYPIEMTGYRKNIYAYCACSAWGVGYWTNKFIEPNLNEMRKISRSPSKLLKIYRTRPISVLNLAIMLYENEVYGDVCTGTKLILDDKVSIFPTISKVRNHGHDGSGEHCGSSLNKLFETQAIDNSDSFEYDDIPLQSISWKPLNAYLSISYKAKIASLLFLFKVWFNKTKNKVQ